MISAVNVHSSGRVGMVIGMSRSVHAAMKLNSATVLKPGPALGTAIRRQTPIGAASASILRAIIMAAAFELIDGVPNYNLYVGGKWIRSSRNEAAESRNPATGELFAKVQQAGAAETELAISAAHGAYKAWAATPVAAREAIFFRAADVLAAKTNEIVDVLIQESGSIAGKAGFEVGFCFDLLRTAAAEMRRSPGETMPLTAPGQFGFTVRQPRSA